jgi:hypothetical protein
MVSLTFYFFTFVTIFAIVGAMRGWAKEMLVTFSAILAMFIIAVLERYVPVVYKSFAQPGSVAQFWMRVIILMILVFFGYQTPNLPRLAGNRFARERLQDILLGFFLGGINGYLVVGTLWSYLSIASYIPTGEYITPPIVGTAMGDAAIQLLNWMPPNWLEVPWLYFVVGIAFIFVIVVFL